MHFLERCKKDREATYYGERFKIFMQYIRALEESRPKYFLYENNSSIHKNIKTEISKFLGVELIIIISAFVLVQHRTICYRINIPYVTQPKDKEIFLYLDIFIAIDCNDPF